MPRGLRYRKEIVALISDITIGAGALVVGGGMFFVIFAMAFFTGTEVGLQGFKGLQQIGAEAFTGRGLVGGQHPRDHPAHRRRGPGRPGGRRLHRPARAPCGSPTRSTPSR